MTRSRREFIAGSALFLLAGCLGQRDGPDLPPPNYDENPGNETETPNDLPIDPDPPEEPEGSGPSEEEQRLFDLYTVAYSTTVETISMVDEALRQYNERSFEAAKQSSISADVHIQGALDVVENEEIFDLAQDLDDNTDMNISEVVDRLTRAAKKADEAAELAIDVNAAREAQDEEEYNSKQSATQIALEQAEFLLPIEPTVFQQRYVQ